MSTPQQPKVIAVRLPANLRAWVEARAAKQERSLNYLITKLIEKAKAEQEETQ